MFRVKIANHLDKPLRLGTRIMKHEGWDQGAMFTRVFSRYRDSSTVTNSKHSRTRSESGSSRRRNNFDESKNAKSTRRGRSMNGKREKRGRSMNRKSAKSGRKLERQQKSRRGLERRKRRCRSMRMRKVRSRRLGIGQELYQPTKSIRSSLLRSLWRGSHLSVPLPCVRLLKHRPMILRLDLDAILGLLSLPLRTCLSRIHLTLFTLYPTALDPLPTH